MDDRKHDIKVKVGSTQQVTQTHMGGQHQAKRHGIRRIQLGWVAVFRGGGG